MKFLLTALAFASTTVWANTEDPKYPVSDIPQELKKDADVVYREDDLTFTIQSRDRSTMVVHQVITILNGNGRDEAIVVAGYDKLSKITSFKGYVYNEQGELIKKLKASEIYDQTSFDGYSLFTDNRFKRADLSQGTYPYTVEFAYEIEFKSLFFVPDYALQTREKIGVEKSTYTLIFPEELRPRYKEHNVTVKPQETTTKDGLKSIRWEFTNAPSIKFEPLAPRSETIVSISAAPSTFEYDDYGGSMQTWKDFGLWIHTLNKGRNVLPPATVQKVKELTATAKTNEEKVKILYHYLQNKTRYVSIQLGIGGYQPFEASLVDQMGYGDCKALSNYMVAMLEQVGVRANYTLINAGESAGSIEVDFPSSQFNHAIVSVPNGKDTLWLECTDQTGPFGYQGSFTGDRKALMITDDGATVVNTLRYTVDQNTQTTAADVYLDLTGNAKATVSTTYRGLRYEKKHLNFILNDQYDKQKQWLQNNIEIPSFNLNSFTITKKDDKIPSAFVTADLSLSRLASVSGKRLFLTPNLVNKWTFIPEKVENRKTSIVLRQAFTDTDTIRYHLPQEIYPEFLPEPVIIKSRFGEYESKFMMDQGEMVYIRRFRHNKGRYPAAAYPELTDFYKSINKADHIKMVFLNKT